MTKRNRVEVIVGSMFSGKTERLIARLRSAREAGSRVQAFKHVIDDRYDPDHLITHTQDRFPAQRVGGPEEIIARTRDLDVVGIDEGHFFGPALPNVVRQLADAAKRVIVVGLQYNAWGRPFETMAELTGMADEVLHMYATCRVCGGQARYSQRMLPVDSPIMVGGADMYEPRCQNCFVPLPGEAPEHR